MSRRGVRNVASDRELPVRRAILPVLVMFTGSVNLRHGEADVRFITVPIASLQDSLPSCLLSTCISVY
jgi:hypothetical protein